MYTRADILQFVNVDYDWAKFSNIWFFTLEPSIIVVLRFRLSLCLRFLCKSLHLTLAPHPFSSAYPSPPPPKMGGIPMSHRSELSIDSLDLLFDADVDPRWVISWKRERGREKERKILCCLGWTHQKLDSEYWKFIKPTRCISQNVRQLKFFPPVKSLKT